VRLCVPAFALVLGFAAWPATPASGQGAVVRVVAPAVWPLDGGNLEVRVEVEGVVDLAAFEFRLGFEPFVVAFEGVEASAFLSSTGRSVDCSGGELYTPQHDLFAFTCSGSNGELPGPSGAGVLATATFRPVDPGPSPLTLTGVKLSDTQGNEIPVVVRQGSVVVDRWAATPVPTATAVPVAPGMERVALVSGCNAVTSTYPSVTPIQTVVGGVVPAADLISAWKFELGAWLAYSPRFVAASDLTDTTFLDFLFICVAAPGSFERPLV
jgi:hypothetical protein